MRIETKRLVLRPFEEKDAQDVFEYLETLTVHCFEDMKVKQEEALDEVKKRMRDDLYVAIECKEDGKVIGEIFSHAETTSPTSSVLDTFSPCWMLHSDYGKKGYGFEACFAYIDYLFNECGARRIYMYTEDSNVACQKLCEKLNARCEGLFKEFVSFINDEQGNPIFENTFQYAILKKEWNQYK